MIKRFLLLTLTVAVVLVGSAKAEDPSTATAWVCSPQKDGRTVKWVISGNKLGKQVQTPIIARRNSPDVSFGEDDEFQIVLNNQYGLIAVAAKAEKQKNVPARATGHMIVIEKSAGDYVETVLEAVGDAAQSGPGFNPAAVARNDMVRGTCIVD
jgi:hypothetical protein